MGSVNPIVFDTSSEEEPDPPGDDFRWLAEFLGVTDEKSDGIDEVAVVSEVKGNLTTERRKSRPWNQAVGNEDDCVVLDGDPDKAEAAAAAGGGGDDDNAAETDEVLVVGERGPIACRDFPHPRHSCAQYPFSSTPHEKYCDMCHCYVCDTRSPCAYWCVGMSSIDHCHANDKEEIWKSQREYLRTGKTTPLPVPRPPPARTPFTVPPNLAQVPTQSLIQLAPNSTPQTQLGIRACSSSTGFTGIANIRSRCRIRQPRSFLHNQGLQQRSVLLPGGVRNSVIQKDRGPTVRNIRPRVVSTNRIAETPRVGGGIMFTNLSGYGSLNNNSNSNNSCNTAQGLQCTQSCPLLAPPNRWQDVSSTNYTQESNSQPNLTGYLSSTPASRNQVYARHLGQNLTTIESRQSQTNLDLFTPSEAPQPMVDCQPVNFQQHGDNNFPQSKILSEFEDWLMANPPLPVSSLTEPVGLNEGESTFDYETLFNK